MKPIDSSGNGKGSKVFTFKQPTDNYSNNRPGNFSGNDPFNSSDKSQSISLFNYQYISDVFDFMPKQFTISTNTGSSQFNILFLMNTSSVISQFLTNFPDKTEYHLDIEDNQNILGKYEKMYQGEFVLFDEEELLISHKITKLLNLVDCPNFLKPEGLKRQETNVGYGPNNHVLGVEINLNSYLQSNDSRTFTIRTNKKEYKCSVFGVYSSAVLHQLLLEDPNKDLYFYDYEDEFDRFQPICDLFNFEKVILTRDNMESIRDIAEDLQIDIILNDVENFINASEKVSKKLDEYQEIVDSVEDLFNLLYSIKEKGIEIVKNSIIDSKWSQTDDNIKELAACIIQVAKTDNLLHQYIIE